MTEKILNFLYKFLLVVALVSAVAFLVSLVQQNSMGIWGFSQSTLGFAIYSFFVWWIYTFVKNWNAENILFVSTHQKTFCWCSAVVFIVFALVEFAISYSLLAPVLGLNLSEVEIAVPSQGIFNSGIFEVVEDGSPLTSMPTPAIRIDVVTPLLSLVLIAAAIFGKTKEIVK